MLLNDSKIAIRIRKDGEGLPEYSNRAGVFVLSRPGETFDICLKNQLTESISAVIGIGGLSVVDGKPLTQTSRGYIILPESKFVLRGWRVDTDHVKEFVFGEQPVRLKAVFFQLDNGNDFSPQDEVLSLLRPVEVEKTGLPLGRQLDARVISQPCHRRGKIAFASIAIIPWEIVVRKASLVTAKSFN